MNTPDFVDLGKHSIYSSDVWKQAWELLNSNFHAKYIHNAWTAVRNVDSTLGINPLEMSNALVKLKR